MAGEQFAQDRFVEKCEEVEDAGADDERPEPRVVALGVRHAARREERLRVAGDTAATEAAGAVRRALVVAATRRRHAAVAARTALEAQLGRVRVAPEVRHGRHVVATPATVRARKTRDVVVVDQADADDRRTVAADDDRVVQLVVVVVSVAQPAVVETVFADRAGLTRVGQLVEAVRPQDAAARHLVQRRVADAQPEAGRAADGDAFYFQRGSVSAVQKDGEFVTCRRHGEGGATQHQSAVRVDDVSLERVAARVAVGEAGASQRDVGVVVDEERAAEEARGVVHEPAAVDVQPAPRHPHGASLAERRQHSVATVRSDPDAVPVHVQRIAGVGDMRGRRPPGRVVLQRAVVDGGDRVAGCVDVQRSAVVDDGVVREAAAAGADSV